jgi:hypothetical protein
MAGDKLDVIIKCRGILGCLPTIHAGRVSRREQDSIQWRFKKAEGTVTITFRTPPPLKEKSSGRSLGTTLVLDGSNNWTSEEYVVDPNVILIGAVHYTYTVSCSECLFIKGRGGDDPQVIIEP